MVANESKKGLTYKDAGVDIEAGAKAVEAISSTVKSTYTKGVLGSLGSFGGLFSLAESNLVDPVLVSGTDGVGTKSLIAMALGRFDTIGIDLVAMCVDDIVCHGAKPLFFLDYISTSNLNTDQVSELVKGMALGCQQAQCALLGGEMAEHPGVLDGQHFDLAGFAVGVVERSELIDPNSINIGDVVIGISSPGLRSNGYSLARKVLLDLGQLSLDSPAYEGASETLGQELLRPSVIYSPALLKMIQKFGKRKLKTNSGIAAIAHITGGGIVHNLQRVLPSGHDIVINRNSWSVPAIFSYIQQLGAISNSEMEKVFNLGIGAAIVISKEQADSAMSYLKDLGHDSWIIGNVIDGNQKVFLKD